MVKGQFLKIVPSIIAISAFLLIWQVLCMGDKPALPPPTKVFSDTLELIINPFFDNGGTDKGLFWQIWASLQRVGLGFSLSAIVGVGLGILIGSNAKIYSAIDPIFQVLRTVPPLAWLPISLAALKENEPSAIFVIFITAIWPIIINTAVGVQQVPQDYRNVSRVLQLSKREYFFSILLPAAAPYIFSGLRIGIGLAWLAIVAAEMLLGGVGIGFFIWDAWNSSLISEIILALIYIGLVGLLLDRFVGLVSQLVVAEDK
ncbi:MAG: nitrate ABC transporter permease [Thermosynechococcaceae cyanobacterium MS004]|nr:nitrate ABC transporter permease [Thermosynechococcaceae cyanobacterium MS004]